MELHATIKKLKAVATAAFNDLRTAEEAFDEAKARYKAISVGADADTKRAVFIALQVKMGVIDLCKERHNEAQRAISEAYSNGIRY